MKRREALKNIGITAGFALATPSIFSLLQSCKSDVATWQPVFFTTEQGTALKGLVDTFLPKTNLPSASEVNVPEFLDKYAQEVSSDEEQEWFKTAFAKLTALLKKDYNSNLGNLEETDYQNLLDNHMHFDKKEGDAETISSFLKHIRSSCINAYRISEQVGENILAYDPVPGGDFTGDLQELTGGKSWSL